MRAAVKDLTDALAEVHGTVSRLRKAARLGGVTKEEARAKAVAAGHPASASVSLQEYATTLAAPLRGSLLECVRYNDKVRDMLAALTTPPLFAAVHPAVTTYVTAVRDALLTGLVEGETTLAARYARMARDIAPDSPLSTAAAAVKATCTPLYMASLDAHSTLCAAVAERASTRPAKRLRTATGAAVQIASSSGSEDEGPGDCLGSEDDDSEDSDEEDSSFDEEEEEEETLAEPFAQFYADCASRAAGASRESLERMRLAFSVVQRRLRECAAAAAAAPPPPPPPPQMSGADAVVVDVDSDNDAMG